MLYLSQIFIFLYHLPSFFHYLHTLNQLVRYHIFLHRIYHRPFNLARCVYKLSIAFTSFSTASDQLTADTAADPEGMESLWTLAAFDEIDDLLGVANCSVCQEVDMAREDVILGWSDDSLERSEDLGTSKVGWKGL